MSDQQSATTASDVVKRTSWDADKQKLTEADCKQSNLEAMGMRGVITPRQVGAGLWLSERWAGYFTPATTSGIEDHAPGSIPADPLLKWAKGQTGFRSVKRGGGYVSVKSPPPPTFRPKRPAELRWAHDGWSPSRLTALQKWIRANRVLQSLPSYERLVVILVAIEGLTLEEVIVRTTGAKAGGGKQRATVKRALHRGLDAIADEFEPGVREIAA